MNQIALVTYAESTELTDDDRLLIKKLCVVASTVFFFITMGGGTATQAQQHLQAPLWGNLSAGSYAVGFKNVYQFDFYVVK